MIDISSIPNDEPLKIIIGAGSQSWENWVPTQGEDLNLLKEQDWAQSFRDRRIDSLVCEHVWEHLTIDDALEAAERCFRYLRPGGFLRCAVPDGYFPDPEYQKMSQVGGPGPSDHPAADHKAVYTYKTFVPIFEKAGFIVDLLEYCDERGRFHYNQWDHKEGPIYRSLLLDHRNKEGKIEFVSLIIDAQKPLG
jgi:predicted SAM-dependent methyltransferase